MKTILISIPLSVLLLSCESKSKKAQTNEMEMPGMSSDELHLSNQQIQLGNITTDSVKEHQLGSEYTINATVNLDQNKVTAVSSRVMGRIEKLFLKNTGETIARGEPLYRIYSEDLNISIREFILANEKYKNLKSDQIDLQRLVESSKTKLKLYGLTDEQINGLNKEDGNSNTIDILSPASGVITSVDKKEGDYVMEGGSIFHLADLSSLWVEGQVYSDYQQFFTQNLPVRVNFPGSWEKPLEGKISFVNPELNANSKINLVRVEILNENGKIKPGMQSNITAMIEEKKAIAIPTDAVILDEKGATVWIKTGENMYKSKMVHTGIEANGYTEILHGLVKGDQVVISGAYLLNSEFIFKKGTNPMEGHDMSKM